MMVSTTPIAMMPTCTTTTGRARRSRARLSSAVGRARATTFLMFSLVSGFRRPKGTQVLRGISRREEKEPGNHRGGVARGARTRVGPPGQAGCRHAADGGEPAGGPGASDQLEIPHRPRPAAAPRGPARRTGACRGPGDAGAGGHVVRAVAGDEHRGTAGHHRPAPVGAGAPAAPAGELLRLDQDRGADLPGDERRRGDPEPGGHRHRAAGGRVHDGDDRARACCSGSTGG